MGALGGGTLDISPIKPNRLVRLDTMSAVVLAAEQGVGVALVPSRLSADRFAAGGLVKLFPAELTTNESYVLLHRPEDHAREDLQELTQWILGRVPGRLSVSAFTTDERNCTPTEIFLVCCLQSALPIVHPGRWYFRLSREYRHEISHHWSRAHDDRHRSAPAVSHASSEEDALECLRARIRGQPGCSRRRGGPCVQSGVSRQSLYRESSMDVYMPRITPSICWPRRKTGERRWRGLAARPISAAQ